jgi:hypothetical protein
MKLPSVGIMMNAARQTLVRFPFSIGFAVVGSLAALIVVDRDITAENPWFVLNNVFVASTLGIALCAAGVFAGERRGTARGRLFIIQGLLALVVAGYGFTLPRDIYSPPYISGIRHWLLLLSVHLLVAFSAFSRRGETQGFWQFNKNLFLRLLVAFLYTGVLQLGLSVALAAVDHLFGLQVRPERYLELWIVLSGIFNTWFFFSGVPERLDELETDASYPRGLKLFTQYVLLPLVVVYLLILYAYLVKIVVTWDWPKGWVANLVLGFSITGIFSLLLIHPLVHKGEERWILRFSRWFYIAEIPLVAILLLAIGRRVQEYGMTESRYFVVFLGLWLAVMTAYFLIRRGASIKVIPASLCALAFLASVGPWSAFDVSERSQLSRLEARLTANQILVDGKVVRREGGVSDEDAREISSGVTYIVDVHGTRALQPWFKEPLDSLAPPRRSPSEGYERRVPRAILAAMGVPFVEGWQGGPAYRMFFARRPAAVKLSGTDLALRGISVTSGSPGMSAPFDGGTVRVNLSGPNLAMFFWQDSAAVDSFSVSLLERAQALYSDSAALRRDSLPVDQMIVRAIVRGTAVLVVPSRIDVSAGKGEFTIRRFEGDVFLGPRGSGRRQ